MTWTDTRLKYLAALPITNGLGEAGQRGEPEWPRYIRTTDINGPRTLREDVRVSLDPTVASAAMLRRNDILICAAGSLGVIHLFDTDEPACFAGYLARFRANAATDPRFIAYWLESSVFHDQVATGAVRSTIDNFSAGKIRNLRLTIPPRDVQSAIADFLDTETTRLDALVFNAHRIVRLTRERLDSELSRVLANRSFERRQMRRVVERIEVGVVVRPATLYAPSGIPFLRGVNISPGRIRLDDLKFLDPTKEQIAAKSTLRTGDLVVVRTGQAGAAAMVPPELDGANCVDLLIVRPGPGLEPRYLELVLNSEVVRSQMAMMTVGSIQSHFNVGALREVLIPVPNIRQQGEIVREAQLIGDRHRQLIAAVDRQIGLLRERRLALITAAVTGRLQVPDATMATEVA